MNRKQFFATGLGAIAAVVGADAADATVVEPDALVILSVREGWECEPEDRARMEALCPALKGRLLIVTGCDVTVVPKTFAERLGGREA